MATRQGDLTASWQGEDVDTSAVERSLARLLHEMNPPDGERGGHPPARTSVLSLIVRAPDGHDEGRAIEALGELAERHPSRTVVVATDPSGEPGLDASVNARCALRAGGEARVCFEEIRLTARGGVAGNLGSVVAPLLIPDLPVFLWWLGEHPEPEEALLQLCDRLIVDSRSCGAAGMMRLERLASDLKGQLIVSDLAWSALEPWRDLLAQLFDPPEARPYQRRLSAVRIHYASGGPLSHPLLLAGWLAVCFGWSPRVSAWLGEGGSRGIEVEGPGGRVEIYLTPAPSPGGRFEPGQLLAVTLVAGRRGEATFSVEREDDPECAEARTALPDRPLSANTMPLPTPSLAALLSRELEQMSRDPLYHESLAWAAEVARAWFVPS